MFSNLENECKSLLSEAIELSYFMRGAISYDAMMNRTYAERQLIGQFVRDRIEQEMKREHPVY